MKDRKVPVPPKGPPARRVQAPSDQRTRFPLIRHGVSQAQLTNAATPAPRPAPASRPWYTAAMINRIPARTFGSLMSLTSNAGQRPTRPEVDPPRPRPPPAATRPQQVCVSQGLRMGTKGLSRAVPLVPLPPRRLLPLGAMGQTFSHVSANTSERVCLTDTLDSLSAIRQARRRARPHLPQAPPAPQAPLAPLAHHPVQLLHSPRLLPKRAQMEKPRYVRVDPSKKARMLPALLPDAPLVCGAAGLLRFRQQQQMERAAQTERASSACYSELPRAILAVLREPQRGAPTSHVTSGSFHTGERDVSDIIYEDTMSPETLRRNAKKANRRRRRRQQRSRRRRINLALPSAQAFCPQPRSPISAHRVVLL
ncbi:hypothetical protein ACEWY4_023033 [Coilia grayii]|uniref:Uncharacterized protein n=1 Tax=Coilia grayii TaxID=363190 RepID=A0ABD1J4E7_9TELE